MTPLPILLTAVFLGTGNCSSKIFHGSFFMQWPSRLVSRLLTYCKAVKQGPNRKDKGDGTRDIDWNIDGNLVRTKSN